MARHISERISRFKEMPLKRQAAFLLPYILSISVCCRTAELYRLCGGNVFRMMENVGYLYRSVPHPVLTDLLIGIPIGVAIIWSIKTDRELHRKNTRPKEEYGSSRWGTAEDIKPFIDPDPSNNIILSQTERLSMEPKMPEFRLNRNKHVLVYGGSGSGKTYGIVKPNMMQLHSSLIVTDPNG